ncbi:hypothetical protein ON010_g12657 [Phytophthora cinnamomi]|nr:hypothetical protein ON010_g12657 [Phytophthora cinnamomi]
MQCSKSSPPKRYYMDYAPGTQCRGISGVTSRLAFHCTLTEYHDGQTPGSCDPRALRLQVFPVRPRAGRNPPGDPQAHGGDRSVTPHGGSVVYVLTKNVAAAQRAPTGFNTQAYVCIVVRSAEDRARLAGAMMDSNIRKINEAPSPSSSRPIAVLHTTASSPDDADALLMRSLFETLQSPVPHAVELFSGERNPIVSTVAWAYKQTTFAAATFLPEPSQVLDIPDRYSIPVVVALGYANPDAKPAKPSVRFPSSEVFFDGEFGQSLAKFFEEE